jgi:protein-tyrosine phosphatase
MHGATRFLLAVLLMGPSPLVCAAERANVKLEGQPNFRDLGGYETADGRKVKSGVVFRSGELHRLTDADVR